MQSDGAGTPEVGVLTTESKSYEPTVMPAADLCETTFVTIKMDKDFTLDSPDHREAPPTRTVSWRSEESLTATERSCQVLLDNACSESSSGCAKKEHGNGYSEETSDRSDNEVSCGSGSESILQAAGSAGIGAARWIIGQKWAVVLAALGILAFGIGIGAHDGHASSSVRAPAAALIPYGHPAERRAARPASLLNGKVDFQVLAAEHMRVAQEMVIQIHEAWSVLVAAAAQEDSFNGRDGSSWPRVSGPTETLHSHVDLYIRAFDRPSFKYGSISEELMNGPWV